MRVIAGKFKGRKLFSPSVNGAVRPTSDRVKENIFNLLLKYDYEQRSVLDLFCGSGALGIEAASRGASRVVFVDNCKESLDLARKNTAAIGLTDCEFVFCDALKALKDLRGRQFGLILADSPYAQDNAQALIDLVFKNSLLQGGGALVIEHSSTKLLQSLNESVIIDTRIYGNSAISIVSHKEANQ